MNKLTYLANIRLPTEKAHGVQIMHTAAAFVQMGVELELVIPTRNNPLIGDPFSFYDLPQTFTITQVRVPDTVRFGRLGFHLQSLLCAIQFYRHLKKYRPDYVYTRDHVGVLAAKFARIPVAWELHTNKTSWLARLAFRSAERVVTISGGLRDHGRELGVPAEKIHVAPDAVALQRFENLPTRDVVRSELGLPPTVPIVGYVGKYRTMAEDKGVDALIEAFREVKAQIPDARLLLVGIGAAERPEVEKALEMARVAPESVSIVGHVPHARIPAYLRAASVLVMAYPAKLHYTRYMSPIKLFEYMASGTPIVSTDLPSVREIVDESMAVLVPADGALSLARGILELLRDKDLSERIAKKARQEVEKYTYQSRAQGILDFLSDKVML